MTRALRRLIGSRLFPARSLLARPLLVSLLSLVLVLPAAVRARAAAQAVTARDVVEACAEAMGGRERIDALRTLRLRYTLPDHGGSQSVTQIMRPNLIRLGDAVVYDGERAAFLVPGTEDDPAPRLGEIVDPEEYVDFEIDVGRYFPTFFDYPAQYQGVEFVAGIETHKLFVLLPLGGRMTYYIDAETHLPLKVDYGMTMYGREYRGERFYGDYREVKGVRFPHAYSYFSPHWRQMLWIEMDEVEIDAPMPEDLFRIPAGGGR